MKEFESIEQFVREGRPHYDPMIDAVICTDLAWTVRYWNPAAERLYGWSAAQAEGRNMGELVPTSYGDVSRERLIERLMDEGEVEGEFVQVCRDGRRVVVWGRVISVRGRAGEPIGALGVNRDVSDLEEALAGLERLAREKEELLLCTRSVLEDGSFETTAHKVFDACCRLTGATSGYVALLDETGRYNDVLFLEPGGAECTVDPDLPMPIRGLRRVAYEEGRAVWDNRFAESEHQPLLPAGHVRLVSVMFAPLHLHGDPVGLLGIANKPGGFGRKDARLTSHFAEIASIALMKSHQREQLRRARDELETRVRERTRKLKETNRRLLEEVAARTRKDLELRANEIRHMSVVSSMNEGIVVVDAGGAVVSANVAARRILGLDAEGVSHRLRPAAGPGRSDDGLDRLSALLHDTLATGRTRRQVVIEVARPDGRRRWLRVNAAPIYEQTPDEPSAAVASFGDFTDQQAAMDALRESEEKFRKFFQGGSVGMAIVGSDGSWLDANEALCRLLGYGRDELISLRWTRILTREQVRSLDEHVKRMVDGELGGLEVDQTLRRSDGSFVEAHLSLSCSLAPDGDLDRVYALVVDISARKRVEDELRRLSLGLQNARESERAHIAREIHDELGQVLTTLQLDLKWIANTLPPGNPRILERVQFARDSVLALTGTVRRIASDLRPGLLDHVGLDAAVQWLVDSFRASAGIPCELGLSDRSTELDPERRTAMYRCLQESLTNVARHADAASVSVTFRDADDGLSMDVVDDGRGFEDGAGAGRGGTGLLGIRERVRALGGAVDISSSPGRGTRLSVRMPWPREEGDDDTSHHSR
jgi:PAS domain S-box-containing protein